MSFFGRLAQRGLTLTEEMMIVDRPLVAQGGVVASYGKKFFVDAANGDDNNNGQSPASAVKTISQGYSLLTANQHDTLYLIGGASGFTISDQLVWAKAYTHMVGIAAPTPNTRARIGNSGNTTSAKALLEVTADGCMFSNFRIFQGSAIAHCGAMEISSDRVYCWNLDLQGQAHATPAAGASAYSLFLNGAGECYFERCKVGIDTVTRSDGSPLKFDGSAARNEFYRCRFVSASETAGNAMVEDVDTSAQDRYTYYEDCLFYNFSVNHAATLNEVFDVATTQTHNIILKNCSAIGITEWATGDTGMIWVIGGTPAAGTAGVGSTGIAVEPS